MKLGQPDVDACGERHQHSGQEYSYFQLVVMHVTVQPVELYMKANVLVPFGMVLLTHCY